jgi:hypothetical protein
VQRRQRRFNNGFRVGHLPLPVYQSVQLAKCPQPSVQQKKRSNRHRLPLQPKSKIVIRPKQGGCFFLLRSCNGAALRSGGICFNRLNLFSSALIFRIKSSGFHPPAVRHTFPQ